MIMHNIHILMPNPSFYMFTGLLTNKVDEIACTANPPEPVALLNINSLRGQLDYCGSRTEYDFLCAHLDTHYNTAKTFGTRDICFFTSHMDIFDLLRVKYKKWCQEDPNLVGDILIVRTTDNNSNIFIEHKFTLHSNGRYSGDTNGIINHGDWHTDILCDLL